MVMNGLLTAIHCDRVMTEARTMPSKAAVNAGLVPVGLA